MRCKVFKSFVLILFVGLICFNFGCVKQETSAASINFGKENETSKKLELLNNTEKDISRVSVKITGQEALTKLDVDPDGETWKNGTLADIFIEPIDESSAKTESANVVVKVTYDIVLTFADTSTSTLHNIVVNSFDSFSNVKLCYQAAYNVVYIEYIDSEDKNMSTLEAEKKIVADAIAAEEAARLAAEAPASSNNYYSSSSNQYTEGCTGGNIAIR